MPREGRKGYLRHTGAALGGQAFKVAALVVLKQIKPTWYRSLKYSSGSLTASRTLGLAVPERIDFLDLPRRVLESCCLPAWLGADLVPKLIPKIPSILRLNALANWRRNQRYRAALKRVSGTSRRANLAPPTRAANSDSGSSGGESTNESAGSAAALLATQYADELSILKLMLEDERVRLPPGRRHPASLMRFAASNGITEGNSITAKATALNSTVNHLKRHAQWYNRMTFASPQVLRPWHSYCRVSGIHRGHVVLELNIGKLVQETSFQQCQQLPKVLVSMMELIVRKLMSDRGDKPSQLIALLNVGDVTLGESMKLLRINTSLVVTLNAHYPGRLHRLYIVDLPASAQWFTQAVLRFVPPTTRRKVRTCTSTDARLPRRADIVPCGRLTAHRRVNPRDDAGSSMHGSPFVRATLGAASPQGRALRFASPAKARVSSSGPVARLMLSPVTSLDHPRSPMTRSRTLGRRLSIAGGPQLPPMAVGVQSELQLRRRNSTLSAGLPLQSLTGRPSFIQSRSPSVSIGEPWIRSEARGLSLPIDFTLPALHSASTSPQQISTLPQCTDSLLQYSCLDTPSQLLHLPLISEQLPPPIRPPIPELSLSHTPRPFLSTPTRGTSSHMNASISRSVLSPVDESPSSTRPVVSHKLPYGALTLDEFDCLRSLRGVLYSDEFGVYEIIILITAVLLLWALVMLPYWPSALLVCLRRPV